MTINSYFLDWILSFQFIRRIVEKHYIYSYEANGFPSKHYRYDCIDRQAMRPIHHSMSVAPPWSILTLYKR